MTSTTSYLFHIPDTYTNLTTINSNLTSTTYLNTALNISIDYPLANSNGNTSINEFVQKEFIFDRIDVRIFLFTIYSLVFCCCFIGEFFFNNLFNYI